MFVLRKFIKRVLLFLVLIFIAPSLVSLGYWAVKDRPGSWHEADWSSAGVLSPKLDEDIIHIMAARTGGMKGALSVHTWILTKRRGDFRFNRYDKVGWGRPVRLNGYDADARWYSNEPYIVETVKGKLASRLIPKVEKAIYKYPYDYRGGYRLWPGPNSNSFVAYVLNEVPEIDAALPPIAVGRSFLGSNRYYLADRSGFNLQVDWRGLFGFAIGRRHGFEIHFMGLTAGVDILNPAIKLPGLGRVGFGEVRALAGTLL